MRKSKFPLCCGVDVLSGFGEAERLQPAGLARWEKSLRDKILASQAASRGLLLAVVSPSQNRGVMPLLKKYNFKELKTVRNPNSSNNITLMGLDLTKDARPRSPERVRGLAPQDRRYVEHFPGEPF